jgi:hypothetical protein
VDWHKVNWFAFFPPLFSIYLALVAGAPGRFLANKVAQAAGRIGQALGGVKPAVQEWLKQSGRGHAEADYQEWARQNLIREDFIRNTAAGWASQLNFINAMLASFVSTISVWSASRSFEGVAVTFFLLLLLFAPMVFYVLSHEPDQIVATKLSWAKVTPAAVCKLVLLLVNVGLIVAIAWGQQLSPPK